MPTKKILAKFKQQSRNSVTQRVNYHLNLRQKTASNSENYFYSGSWQTFVAEEFSRRMQEFVNGSRLESLSWISRQEKEAKCQCCNYFEETHTRKCLVQEKCEKLRIATDVIFSCDVTEGHLKGNFLFSGFYIRPLDFSQPY
jgi:hypothetical protein